MTVNHKSYIYFIKSEKTGNIKIGTSTNPGFRLDAIKAEQRDRSLSIIALLSGGYSKEKELHGLFSEFRVYGEWFLPDQSILDYINGVKENTEPIPPIRKNSTMISRVFNIEGQHQKQLKELSYQTGVAKSEILRRLFRFLPQIRQELINEAKKRLNDGL